MTTKRDTENQLERRWAALTFDGLTIWEKEAVALFWLDGDVFNGGLHQYFDNSSGDLAPYALSALSRLGALKQLDLLKAAIAKLSMDTDQLPNQNARQERLEQLGWEPDPFDSETRAWYAMNESMYDLALKDLADLYAARFPPTFGEAGVVSLLVRIVRFANDTQPGWVECHLADAHGRIHTFVEKAPVVSVENLGPETTYPKAGTFACKVVTELHDEHFGRVIRVNTEHPWGIVSTAGVSTFDILPTQLV